MDTTSHTLYHRNSRHGPTSMVTLQLLNHRLLIEPPQHLLVVWITDRVSGAQMTVFHKSGYEAEGMVLAGSPTPSIEAETVRNGEVEVPTPLPAGYLATFPEITEIDLWNVPGEYKALTDPVVDRFHLCAGNTYSVALVGNTMVQATVVAE